MTKLKSVSNRRRDNLIALVCCCLLFCCVFIRMGSCRYRPMHRAGVGFYDSKNRLEAWPIRERYKESNDDDFRIKKHSPRHSNDIDCGETNKDGKRNSGTTSGYIFGGRGALPGEFPYQVLLVVNWNYVCGGAIISSHYILTAAHCVIRNYPLYGIVDIIRPSQVKVYLGDLNMKIDDGESEIRVDEVIVNDGYVEYEKYTINDVALLRTSKAIEWKFTSDGNGSINRVCLPKGRIGPKTEEMVTVSGWGKLVDDSDTPSITLMAVDVPIVDVNKCKQQLSVLMSQSPNGTICAGLDQGGRDACHGDSGGPLVRWVDGRAVLAGIVSYGIGCALPNSPGVYTDVAYHLDWIKKNMNNEYRDYIRPERDEDYQHDYLKYEEATGILARLKNKNKEEGLRYWSKPTRTLIDGYIIGGRQAKYGEFPYQAMILMVGTRHCGGVVLDERHVLSAGHCVINSYDNVVQPRFMKVVVGENDLDVKDGEQIHEIERVEPHPNLTLTFRTNANDLCILKTKTPMNLTITPDGRGSVASIRFRRAQTIALKAGDMTTVCGWGKLSEVGAYSTKLMSVDVPIFPMDLCQSLFSDYNIDVMPGTICAGYKEGGMDSCHGDSGGPLIRKVDGYDELIGIVSFGQGCARPNLPGLYTDVAHYADWIDAQLKK